MKQILCFGDSNTWGLIPKTNQRYPWGVRWTSILDNELNRHFNNEYRVIEEGLCGRTTVFDDPLRDGRNSFKLLPTILESHNPVTDVIIMLGTNDCKTVYNASAEVIGQGVERLINQVKSCLPHSRILLVSPIHLGKGVWEQDYDPEFSEASVEVSKKLAGVYSKIAEKESIDFLSASDAAKPSEIDREHLNEQGHKELARNILRWFDI
jgi:lysophospholipase L1-like esterase